MSRLRHGWLITLLCGAMWGALMMMATGVLLMLATGLEIQPAVGASATAGVVGAFVLITINPSRHPRLNFVLSAAAYAITLLLLTYVRPFGIDLTLATGVQIIGLVVLAGTIGFANGRCLEGLPLGSLSRHQFELALIGLTKGFFLVFFVVIVALPFYVMVMTSLKSQQALLANPLDFSISMDQGIAPLMRSYHELFTDYNFGRYLLTTTFVSVTTVLITLLFAVPGAYAVARLRFPGRKTMTRSILMIYMVPTIVLVIPLYAVFSQLGLRNTLLGLLIVYPATTIPVALYMLQGYFRGLPTEIEEAGVMDGLSRLGVIRKIMLPLAMPALASVSLYVFMIAWNEFLFAFMFLDDPKIFTLSRGVVSLNSSEVPRQHLMAGAVVATVPILILFLWFEKFLVQGLTSGSVKG